VEKVSDLGRADFIFALSVKIDLIDGATGSYKLNFHSVTVTTTPDRKAVRPGTEPSSKARPKGLGWTRLEPVINFW